MEKQLQEKFTTIAKNQNAIKELGISEGISLGIKEAAANSKYIEKQVSGSVISLNDVSEVYHKVKVYGDNQEVEVYGKNLFDIATDTRFTKQEDGSYINNARIQEIDIPLELPYGEYVISYDLSCPVGKNARIRIRFKDGTIIDAYKASTNDFVHFEKTIVGEIVAWMITYASQPLQGEVVIKDAQIEVGSVATPSKPYTHQTITATPTGTEIGSMCPNMTFIADSDITVDYFSSFGMAEKELAMWNALTNYGQRESYDRLLSYADFSGYEIPKGLCKPKVSIGYMCYAYRGEELPKGIDCSAFNAGTTVASYYGYLFSYAIKLKYIYDLGIPALKSYASCYRNNNALEAIEVIRVSEETTFDNNSFLDCTKLKHVIFSGVIASDINLQWSPLLDDESLINISVTLCDLVFSGFGDGWGSRTLILSAESIARLKELPYPPDDLNPEGGSYAEDGADCYTVIVSRKAWNIA